MYLLFKPLKGTLQRIGNNWMRTSDRKRFDVLLSDITWDEGGTGTYKGRFTNHNELLTNLYTAAVGGWPDQYHWAVKKYSKLFPRTSANYALTDGSVHLYPIPLSMNAYGTTQNFSKLKGQELPDDLIRN